MLLSINLYADRPGGRFLHGAGMTDNSRYIPWFYVDSTVDNLYRVFRPMNSIERHEARYKRRRFKRLLKKETLRSQYDDFYVAFNRTALSRACHKASLTVGWKCSVKRFNYHKLTNIKHLSDRLEVGLSVHKNFICFYLVERGKKRFIMSVRFSERVVQKALCQNVLYPLLTRNLIYDNMANQKGKGTKLARQRLKELLSWHYRRYGIEGYVLIIDFQHYFENLDHNVIRELVSDNVKTDKIFIVADRQLKDYEKHYGRPIGLGLGSEQNQIYAVVAPNRLDHFIKERLRIHCYERYQDDAVLIHRSKLYLEECLKEIRIECKKYGFIINEKKTGIIKLSRGFTFLKTQYKLTETGRVIMKPGRKSIANERRKLKKQAALLLSEEMTLKEFTCSFRSWYGSMLGRDSYRSRESVKALYNSIVKEVKDNDRRGERKDRGRDCRFKTVA